jgi:hypothetical protein
VDSTPRVEVEDAETALEIAASGPADTISARGILLRLADRLPPTLGWVPLRPATRAVVEIAASRMGALAAAVRSRGRRIT